MKPTYEQLEDHIARLEAHIARLEAHIARLEAKVAELESRLNKNSKNSSKPPSSDQKENTPSPPKKEKRPYHPGASRQLLPEEMVTSRETRSIPVCPRCQSATKPNGDIQKWQQIEFPEIKPLVHQIELETCVCPRCQLVCRPHLEESEQYVTGPRLEALINVFMGRFKQGHRPVRELIALLVPGLQLSQGLIAKIKARGALALDTAHGAILEVIKNSSDPIHMDASSWRHQGKNEHIIVLRTGNWVGFKLESKQNGEVLRTISGGRVAHLVTDRGLAFGRITTQVHQYCLAHLIRNIRGLAEDKSTPLEDTQKLGEIHDALQQLFIDKHRLDRGEIVESTWKQYGYGVWAWIKAAIDEILAGKPPDKVRGACARLYNDLSGFKVYLGSRNYPMTNNPAEEALRNLVIARKLCFGSRSEYGRKWREAIHSCTESLRRQGRSVLDFIATAIKAYRHGATSPDIIVC